MTYWFMLTLRISVTPIESFSIKIKIIIIIIIIIIIFFTIIILLCTLLQLSCLQLNMYVIINYLNYLLTHSKYFQHFVALMHLYRVGIS
jgi:hypothetical protein